LKISIVIPVYKSELFVEKTVTEILLHLEKIPGMSEVILVDDGSPDNSWSVISRLATEISNVRAIKLIKNYGQHTAVLCGIEHAKGDYIITMDDDLQNPPSEIVKLVDKIEEGYDLVFAKFEEKKHASYRKMGTRVIDLLNKKIFHKPDNIVLTNFRIFKKTVAQRIVKYRVNEPYIPGLLLMHASKIANVLTKHAHRDSGQSNYSLRKIASLVSRLLFNYSSFPLKALSTIGAFIAVASFCWGTAAIIRQLIFGTSIQGWTTLVVLVSFLNGFVILLLGVLGEYVVRISKTISHDRSYHISEDVE
jgi:glycosyltransferase involved in cell wall biosynthesis